MVATKYSSLFRPVFQAGVSARMHNLSSPIIHKTAKPISPDHVICLPDVCTLSAMLTQCAIAPVWLESELGNLFLGGKGAIQPYATHFFNHLSLYECLNHNCNNTMRNKINQSTDFYSFVLT